VIWWSYIILIAGIRFFLTHSLVSRCSLCVCLFICLCIGDVLSTESVWSLALVIKSVVMAAVDADGECSIISLLMHQHEFVESVSYLAQLGTGLSRKWHVKDLEVTDFVSALVVIRILSWSLMADCHCYCWPALPKRQICNGSRSVVCHLSVIRPLSVPCSYLEN